MKKINIFEDGLNQVTYSLRKGGKHADGFVKTIWVELTIMVIKEYWLTDSEGNVLKVLKPHEAKQWIADGKIKNEYIENAKR